MPPVIVVFGFFVDLLGLVQCGYYISMTDCRLSLSKTVFLQILAFDVTSVLREVCFNRYSYSISY